MDVFKNSFITGLGYTTSFVTVMKLLDIFKVFKKYEPDLGDPGNPGEDVDEPTFLNVDDDSRYKSLFG